jgi:hypothetical protein
VRGTLITARSIRLLGAACIAALLAGPLRAACTDTYPDSQVTQKLAKDAYATCGLETMKADYAVILKEQARLLTQLRPAYERAVLKDPTLGKAAVQQRLKEFDERGKDLTGLADAIAAGAKAPNKGDKGDKGKAAGDGNKLLQNGRIVSELLRSRIAHARESLEPQETDTYCKLDFHFRWGEALAGLVRKCVK